jgi:hypothetical protein
MLVLNLRCSLDHGFEGWFGSAADFESQLQRGLITCPICADAQITRMPSAPHLNVSHLRSGPLTPSAVQSVPAPAPAALQSRLQAAVAAVLANTEDVGERFAEEARRIHYGETEAHGIRGQASLSDVADLVEEGIAVLPFAMPPALKGQLQ